MMDDKRFNKLLKKLSGANAVYKDLLGKAENVIKEKYGYYPSDIDCDGWIDCYHVGIGHISAEEVDKEMKFSIRINGD